MFLLAPQSCALMGLALLSKADAKIVTPLLPPLCWSVWDENYTIIFTRLFSFREREQARE